MRRRRPPGLRVPVCGVLRVLAFGSARVGRRGRPPRCVGRPIAGPGLARVAAAFFAAESATDERRFGRVPLRRARGKAKGATCCPPGFTQVVP